MALTSTLCSSSVGITDALDDELAGTLAGELAGALAGVFAWAWASPENAVADASKIVSMARYLEGVRVDVSADVSADVKADATGIMSISLNYYSAEQERICSCSSVYACILHKALNWARKGSASKLIFQSVVTFSA